MSDFISQFPYTDFHEMNLDWLIKKTKQLQADMKEVQEELAVIEVLTEDQINAMIQAAIASNNIQIYNDLQILKSDITAAYQAYCMQQINLLKTYVDNQDVYYDNKAATYAEEALTEAKNYTDDQVLTYTMMINPITGVYEDVRIVVNDIVSYFHTQDALTASEYDALDLTAAAYDAYNMTAYDYDFSGKTILNP